MTGVPRPPRGPVPARLGGMGGVAEPAGAGRRVAQHASALRGGSGLGRAVGREPPALGRASRERSLSAAVDPGMPHAALDGEVPPLALVARLDRGEQLVRVTVDCGWPAPPERLREAHGISRGRR